MLLFFGKVTATAAIYTYEHPLSRNDARPTSTRVVAFRRIEHAGGQAHVGVADQAAHGFAQRVGDAAILARVDCSIDTIDQGAATGKLHGQHGRSEEHTSELQSLMRISYAVFCLNKKRNTHVEHPYHVK